MNHFLRPFATDRPIGARRAIRIATRLGFGARAAELETLSQLDAVRAVDHLLSPGGEPPLEDPIRPYRGGSLNAYDDARSWWLGEMLDQGSHVRERLALIWHDHFACTMSKPISLPAMLVQNEILRGRGVGPFSALVHDVVHGRAMQVMLDGPSNVKGAPNENLAREILELFCLGLGAYGGTDVKELARALTGWTVEGVRPQLDGAMHDDGVKNLLGVTGRFGSAEALDVVLADPACARHIVLKLATHVVGVAPSVPEVEQLAKGFREDEMHVGRLLRRLATSEAMLGESTFRTRVPSPVTLCVTLARRLDLTLSPAPLLGVIERAGQTLFVPPGVDGWPHDRDWLTSTWALHRAELAFLLLDEALKHGLPDGLTQDDPTEWIASRLSMDEHSRTHFERAGAHLRRLGHRSDQLARRLLALPRSQMQ